MFLCARHEGTARPTAPILTSRTQAEVVVEAQPPGHARDGLLHLGALLEDLDLEQRARPVLAPGGAELVELQQRVVLRGPRQLHLVGRLGEQARRERLRALLRALRRRVAELRGNSVQTALL